MIAAGGEIRYTQDPVNIADLIGRFMFSTTDKAPPSAGQGSSDQPPPAGASTQ